MQEGLRDGQDAAEGGHFYNWSKGSDGAKGEKPTRKMGRTAEDKQQGPYTELAPEGGQDIGKDSQSRRMQEGLHDGQDAAEGGHFYNWSKGSGHAKEGKPTPKMGQTAEDKQ